MKCSFERSRDGNPLFFLEGGGKAANIPDRISIHERPKVSDGLRFGDWEP